jgi:BirA family transcriptional regulator, biotin operon repressor / biotin---[acetyl-CoA-carboxylase] ligase
VTSKKNHLPLIELDEVESTNNYAMGWVKGLHLPKGHEQLINGMAVLAYHQTAGRGQRGKSWQSPKGESMSLSIALQPHFLKATEGFALLSAVAVAVARVLQQYTGNETTIKWPNDVYWQRRKLGGILIENVIKEGAFRWAVVGIGINVKQASFPAHLQNPVSIKQITGKEMDVKELTVEIQEAVTGAMEKLAENPLAFFEEYNQLLFCRNEKTKLKQGSRVFETVIKGVNTFGELMTGKDGTQVFQFGDVEWKL